MTHAVTSPPPPFRSRSGHLEVHQIPAAFDNFIWVLVCTRTQEAAVVDGPDAAGLVAYCKRHGIRLRAVLNTHTHPDHIGVNLELSRLGLLEGMRVYGPARRAGEVPGMTDPVDEGDSVRVGDAEGRVMLTEGHIDGHVTYLFDDIMFCGDTLFAGGCGYLFDGPPDKMYRSLSRLRGLSPDTVVCCAHEYTQDNLRFAWTVEPENPALAERIRDVWARRERGEATVPSTVGLELETNPFLRFDSPSLREHVRAAWPDEPLESDASFFAATRALKDRKDYRRAPEAELPLACD